MTPILSGLCNKMPSSDLTKILSKHVRIKQKTWENVWGQTHQISPMRVCLKYKVCALKIHYQCGCRMLSTWAALQQIATADTTAPRLCFTVFPGLFLWCSVLWSTEPPLEATVEEINRTNSCHLRFKCFCNATLTNRYLQRGDRREEPRNDGTWI